MPTLQVAIDANRAKTGAADFNSAAERVIAAAERTATATERLATSMVKPTVAMSAADKQSLAWRNQLTKLASALAFATRTVIGLSAAVAGMVLLRSVTSFIMDFEKQLARLQGVVNGTAEDLQRLADTARFFGATTIFTATEAASAMLALAQSGFTVDQTIEALTGTLNLAAAGVIGLDQAASVTANTIRQFALAPREAARVTDVFVNTANLTNTTVLRLAEAMEYSGPIAAAFGLSLEQTAASLGVLANRGIDASIAGTNLRGILATLAGLTPKAKGILQDLGVDLQKLDPQLNEFVDVLETLRAAGLSAGEATAVFNKRNAASLLVLMAATDEIRNLTAANEESAGVAQRNADLINDSLYGSFKRLKSAVQEVFLAIGDGGLGGGLKVLLDTLTGALQVFTGIETPGKKVTEMVEGLAATIKFLTMSLAGLVTVKAATFLWGLIPPMIAGRTAAFSFGLAVRSLYAALGPAGWLVIGISSAITAVDYFSSQIDDGSGSLDDMRLKAISLGDELERLATIMASQKFAVESQDLQGQIDALKALQRLQKDAAIRLTGERDSGRRIAEIDALRNLIQSSEGQKELNAVIQGINKSFMRKDGSVNLSAMMDSPYFGLSAADQDANKQMQEEANRFYKETGIQMSTSLHQAEVYAVPLTEAIRILRAEMDRTGESASEIVKQMELMAKGDAVSQATQLHAELLRSLQEERALIPMTAAERKGELAVREALKIAAENEISLTETQIEQIREWASGNEDRTQSMQRYLQAQDEANRKAVQSLEDDERATASIKEMISALDDEIALLSVEKSKRDELQAVLRAENIARGRNVAGLDGMLDSLREMVRTLAALEEADNTAESIEKLDKYIEELENETLLLGLSVDAREVRTAQLRAEAMATGVSTEAMGDYLKRIEEEVRLQQKLRNDAKTQKKSDDFYGDVGEKFRALEIERRLIGRTNDERERALEIARMQKDAEEAGIPKTDIDNITAQYDAKLEQLQRLRELDKLAQDIGNSFADAFSEFITGAKSAEEAMESLYKSIIQLMVREAVARPISQGLSSAFAGMYANARGNVYTHGRLTAFADGGVVTSPMIFPMSGGGAGLMGEAGPEAIMPLSRGRDGKLGVRTADSGGSTVTVNMRVYAQDANSFRATARQTMARVKNEADAASRRR